MKITLFIGFKIGERRRANFRRDRGEGSRRRIEEKDRGEGSRRRIEEKDRGEG